MPGPRRVRIALAAVATALLLLTACGTRVPKAELEAALRPAGGQPSAVATVGPSDGAGHAPAPVNPSAAPPPAGDTGSGAPVSSGPASEPDAAPTSAGATAAPGSSATASDGRARAGSRSIGPDPVLPGVDRNCAKQLTPVNLASVGEQSGLAGAAVAGGAQAVAAWAAYVNSLGGLRCHPIHYTMADDGADPSRNASLTEQLVEQDHVVGFLYNDAPLAAQGSEQYLISHHIPVVGSEGGEDFYNNYPNFFPQGPSGRFAIYAIFAGLPSQITRDQREHVGLVVCLEAAECSQFGTAAGKADLKQVGLHLVYSSKASLTAPDFTSQCLGAKKAGTRFLIIILDPNSIHRMAANCRNAGYTGRFGAVSQIVTADDATDPNLDNMAFDSVVLPWTTTGNAQLDLMHQVLARYAPGLSDVGSPASGWTSAQIFDYSARFWPNHDIITSADIIRALDKVKNYDVGGLTGPVTYVKDKPDQNRLCWYEMGVRNGRFFSPNNGARSCK
jgi:branched-chain amino acid transport system substrate-binding protein